MKARLGSLVWLALAAWLAGCASVPGGDWCQTDTFPAPSFNPAPLARPILAHQEKLYVRPPFPQYTARAGLLRFRCPPHLPEAGRALTRIFYRRLLKRRPFLEVVLLPESFGSLPEAVARGRTYGMDVVLLGEVPYLLDGGGLGKSGLQVDLKVVEVKTGRLLWEIREAVAATQRPVVDLWVTETRPRPTPPLYELADRLAVRLCQALREQPGLTALRQAPR